MLPPIWAQSRQEVCESFDWFRSYQGGVYFVNNIVKGYLLSGFPAQRDGFFHNGKLVISHGGGKAESLQFSEGRVKLKPADDQKADDKSVRALLYNYNHRIPLVLLIDDRYALFPLNLQALHITYAVLGVYYITRAVRISDLLPQLALKSGIPQPLLLTAEREITESGRTYVRFKFAFQWCEDQKGQPWWHSPVFDTIHPPVTISPILHDLLIDNESDTRTTEMDYQDMDESIPVASSSSESVQIFKQTRRRVPVRRSKFYLSEKRPGLEDRICSFCRTSSPLVFAEGWGCLNASCQYFWTLPERGLTYFSELLEFDPEFLQICPLPPLDPGYRNIIPSQPVARPLNAITTTQLFSRGMHCALCGRLSCRYKWQHWECAHCHNIIPISGSIRRALDLKNHHTGVTFDYNFVRKDTGVIRQSPSSFEKGHVQTFLLPEGRGRVHHIQHNSQFTQQMDGLFEEYQRQASDGTLPFMRWPLRSHKLRGALLTNYFSQNCGEPYHVESFVAYVGGTANTLPWDRAPSAVVKAKAFIEERVNLALGMSLDFNEVLSAAYMDKQKMSFHTDDEKGLGDTVAGLSLGSPALMHFRRRDVKHGPERKSCLSIVLRHGDVLVMEGAGVQQFYEHMVEPTSFRIAATARWIDPNRS
ncbi:hypothetical protein D9757_004253 [Collybiopsis confluens]|uniref:Fe2OG dioxygenase domain-containing protein n=1 Tax=Collybiopsis confluens TaxID=2823264 RepID=A0A8H5HTY3_9AGAR|nr:hypothetical protein D9757_004253 [Collybiopsis confluens]